MTTLAQIQAMIVTDAQRYLRVPYFYGGKTVPPGLDCSGLTSIVMSDLGVPAQSQQYPNGYPAGSAAQCNGQSSQVGPHVGPPQPGDYVFFFGGESSGPRPGHVGICTSAPGPNGIGVMINAPYTGVNVRYDNFSMQIATGYMGATRVAYLLNPTMIKDEPMVGKAQGTQGPWYWITPRGKYPLSEKELYNWNHTLSLPIYPNLDPTGLSNIPTV
jgi:hypothetical protein